MQEERQNEEQKQRSRSKKFVRREPMGPVELTSGLSSTL